MNITICGAGYVGLTTGAAFAYLGHDVTWVDVDTKKIDSLRAGKCPFFEPWLDEFLKLAKGHCHFRTDYETVSKADVVFITVGTPQRPDGNPDLSAVQSATYAVGEHLNGKFTVVVNKSTVPIGSGNWVEAIVREAYEKRHGDKAAGHFAITSNPEFLRQGSALEDILYPDRVVVGADDQKAMEILRELYSPLLNQSFAPPAFLPRPQCMEQVPFISTDLASAELMKYAANAFLSLKISFINEIGQLAERVGADITQVARGIGLDARIGSKFLQAGLGWGGSCFGKDSAALVATANDYGLSMPIIQASRDVNYKQRARVVEKLLDELKILRGRTVGLLGLSFKPQTDDLRDAPALDIAQRLINKGVRVKVHDPIAMDRAKELHSELAVTYCDDISDVVEESDALVLITDWPEYGTLPWKEVASKMRNAVILDGRNFLDKKRLQKAGFTYLGMGR